MSDLRTQAIEAMALEMCQQRGEDDHPDRPTCSFNRWLAEAALDALLDFLTEHQEEWADTWRRRTNPEPDEPLLPRLLEALR